jgi:hypothetical protein
MTRVITKTATGSFYSFATADAACGKCVGKSGGSGRKGTRRPCAGLMERDGETVIRFLPLPANERRGKEYTEMGYWVKDA